MAVSMRYARVEREHRFLLRATAPADPAARVLHIRDRYLGGTRLRLRVVDERDREPVRKLGQKIPLHDRPPTGVAHTTLYLDQAEYRLLAVLPAAELAKTRTLLPWDGLVLAVDVFLGPLAGLALAEVDLGGSDRQLPAPLPLAVAADVTGDERFTGGSLAASCRTALLALLDEYGIPAR